MTNDGEVAYDEEFHRGVNIIRGQNSSGKSTIVRFIFFVLGGYYTDFVPQAMKCLYVMAEVSINGTIVTLQRFLEKREDGKANGYAPMYIYYGPMEEAIEQRNRYEWKKYPYVTTDKTSSFSSVLFDMLGYPPIKADSNITMHQVLRLIYLDQESPVNSLFFYEQFDKEIYRESVANLLLGLYDQRYSDAKQALRDTVRAISETKVSIKNVGEFLQDSRCRSSAYIRGQIDNLNEGITWITKQIQDLRKTSQVSDIQQYAFEEERLERLLPEPKRVECLPVKIEDDKLSTKVKKASPIEKVTEIDKEYIQYVAPIHAPKMKLEYQRILEDITKQRKECDNLEREIKHLENEIEDSNYFIDALNKRKAAILHSIATRNYFDAMHLDFCPECLTPINHEAEEGHCPLCKSPIDSTKGKSHAMRIKLELEFQIRESMGLKEENEQALEEKKAQLKRMRRQLNATQKHYDFAVGNVRSTHEEQIDKLLQDKGFKEGEILQYQTMLEQAEKYENLLKELDRLKDREAELERFVEATEKRIRMERRSIDEAVSKCGVYLLRNDLGRQEDFMRAQDFVIDYNQNMAYISDQRNKLSASSAFYLKMVARFAILFASLKLDSMIYPRLLFSDNMEDKGLTIDRAVNFQRTVVNLLSKVPQDDFQLIFATSMLAPELNVPEFTIGEEYTVLNKSLKNV